MTLTASTPVLVVSMLAGLEKITLITQSGTLIDIKHNEDYDTAKIIEHLTGRLSGTNTVELKLTDYAITPPMPEITETLQEGGIEITQMIDGVEVQGIFYPKKTKVIVAVDNEVIEVPGLDNLMRHAKRAKEYGMEAIKAFLLRMTPVLKTRAHSAEDLMNFIGNSEMPLTLDGRVICYKRLNGSRNSNETQYWVDPYTHTVKQRIGSIVEMEEVDVDPSRYNSCSNGLHVANQTYFGGSGFSGKNTFVVLVNPEDFIAVPKGEHGKARVTRYQIIGMLNNDAHKEISQGYVKDNDALKQLIANAIEGRITPAIEVVKVGKRGYISTSPIENVAPMKIGSAKLATLEAARSLDADPQEKKPEPAPIKPMQDGSKAVQALAPTTIPDEVVKAFTSLREGVKSKAAIARDLNTSTRSLDRWMDKYGYESWKKTMDSAVAADAATETTENLEAASQMFETITQNKPKPTMPVKAKPPTKIEIIRGMINSAKTAEDYKNILSYKKLSKKGWSDLGVSNQEVDTIMKGSVKSDSLFDLHLSQSPNANGKFIETIKVMRQALNLGLKESKDLIESGKLLSGVSKKVISDLAKELTRRGINTTMTPAGSPPPQMKETEIKSSVQNQTAPLSKAQQARLLFEQKNFEKLRQFKKNSKKSWEVLGFNQHEIGQITN